MITVKDLIEKLQTLPSELSVVIPGGENGYSDIEKVFCDRILRRTNIEAHWNGMYSRYHAKQDPDGIHLDKVFKAIILK